MRKISLLLVLVLLLAGCSNAAPASSAPASSAPAASSSPAPSAPAPSAPAAPTAPQSAYPQLAVPQDAPTLTLHTSAGDVTLALFPEAAPKAVENFLTHAKNGYYDNQVFHRVIKDFMIQGGDPTASGRGGESIWGKAFEDEFTDTLYCLRGALAMANAGKNTNGSQFFIVQATTLPDAYSKAMEKAGYPAEIVAAYRASGGTPWLDGKHTVFGQVTAGMEVVDAIASAAVQGDAPVEPVKISSIEVVRDWVKG